MLRVSFCYIFRVHAMISFFLIAMRVRFSGSVYRQILLLHDDYESFIYMYVHISSTGQVAYRRFRRPFLHNNARLNCTCNGDYIFYGNNFIAVSICNIVWACRVCLTVEINYFFMIMVVLCIASVPFWQM